MKPPNPIGSNDLAQVQKYVGNINVDIQRLLKKKDFYEDDIDGKLGPASYDAMALLAQSLDHDTSGWSRVRLKTFAEAEVYKSLGLSVGNNDGKVDHTVTEAREDYKTDAVKNFRDKADELFKEGIVPAAVKKVFTQTTPSTNWPRQSECSSFYGGVGTNQTTLVLPYQMVLAWEPKTVIKKFSCHKKVVTNMERIFSRTLDHYGYEKIKELRLHYWGGCLNVRKMRGGSSWSMHSWGIAVDMDPDRNALRTSWKNAQMSKPAYKKFVEFWYDEGAINLGVERDYDAMHFQLCRL